MPSQIGGFPFLRPFNACDNALIVSDAVTYILKEAFEKIDKDFAALLNLFQGVLDELNEKKLAEILRHRVEVIPPEGFVDSTRLEQLFSIVFQLLNMVEENVASQARRKRQNILGSDCEPGLWGERLKRLASSGLQPEFIAQRLRHISIEPVLTAHPTEAKRATVLEQHRQLYLLLVQLENTMWTPAERSHLNDEIKTAIERLWRTGEIYLEKPNIASERRNVIYYLRHGFPPAVARHDQNLRDVWQDLGWDIKLLENPLNLPRISFGTWVGGDRDGHPLVTAQVTRESLEELRQNAIELHRDRLTDLVKKLSLSGLLQIPPQEFASALDQRINSLGHIGESIIRRNPGEPWRNFVSTMIIRLPLAPGQSNPYFEFGENVPVVPYRAASELLDDLMILRKSLLEINARRLANMDVDPLIRAVQVFGFHLATLDIRQNSQFHDKAVSQLLETANISPANFSEWSEEQRLQFLESELVTTRPFSHERISVGKEADSVRDTYRVITQWIDAYGYDGLGSLILSMTRSVSDLLTIYLLAREGGLLCKDSQGHWVCPLPVVPLFETNDDLHRAPEILDKFLAFPMTRRSLAHIAARRAEKPLVQVMIGYSDSNKDGGLLSAQWALHQAQKAMSKVATKHGVEICFFHGRGGTISRGAGPTHRFIEALPYDTVWGSIRLTEQGETIAQKYANPLTATHNLELLSAGVAYRAIGRAAAMQTDKANSSESPIAQAKKTRFGTTDDHTVSGILDQLSELSMTAYRSLIEADGFMTFYSQATPIDALEAARIGSRPTRRTGRNSISDLRAIPWVFSWTQARYYLPGWYGLGSALGSIETEHPGALQLVRQTLETSPFLRYVLTNAETNLASASTDIMQEYATLVSEDALRKKFLGLILDEYIRTKNILDQLFGGDMEIRRPRMIRTISMRRQGLTLLHQRQVSLLRRWRDARQTGDEEAAEKMLPDLLLSINAIASGLRTTG